MTRHRAVFAILVGALVLGSASPRTQPADIERRIDDVLARMTLEEKFGQLQQLDGLAEGDYRPEHLDLVRKGRLGSTLNVRGARVTNALQRVALEESRLRIPLIFAFDVIHGYRTIFPVPLAEAATWDPVAVERAAAIAAAEAKAAGLHWTFAPMVDIARDARWGRIVEGAGEDPWLGSVMAAARVRGFQGTDVSAGDRVAATAKHWVAYGAAEAGRDYNTTDLSEHTLRTIYFPPFKAALDAGALTVMSAFNDLNGVPTSANPFTLDQVLRKEWRWDGLVVSDYKSVVEIANHGLAADDADAARLALPAGVDMEMVSRAYVTHGPSLVARGALSQATVDEAVRRALRLKFRAGLMESPYPWADEARERETLLRPEHRQAARETAARSFVLLKNEARTLPLRAEVKRIALLGPLADDRENMLGSWTGDGRKEDVVTLREGLRRALPGAEIVYHPGCAADDCFRDRASGPPARVALAALDGADAVVLAIGESAAMSGEAASRTTLDLPPAQMALARAVLDQTSRAAARRVPVAVVLFGGRALTIGELADRAPAILMAWFPGTEAGHALADVLLGKASPGGKLPITFPRTVGQVPLYYNHRSTGRPPDEKDKYTSKYLDTPWTPLFPFGHGLSYTTFALSNLALSATTIPASGQVRVSVDVRNTGSVAGDEVVQLYLRDPVASVTRPVAELKGFSRVSLQPGESKTVAFTLGPEHLGFYGRDMKWVVESGEFLVRVGTNAVEGLETRFEVR